MTVVPGPAEARSRAPRGPATSPGCSPWCSSCSRVVQPDVAVFGRKDVQQAALVRRMVRDLTVPVEVVVAPTVRESDGLALSSRNVYLDAAARTAAAALPRALARGVAAFRSGERDGATVAAAARPVLDDRAGARDGVRGVRRPGGPSRRRRVPASGVLAVAARAGRTRLIDNVVLGDGLEKDVRVAG